MTSLGKKICIIGAGPAGLCTLRQLLSSQVPIQVILFEQQADIGGVWNFSKDNYVPIYDENGNKMVFPMYEDLRCNLPKQLMEFRDFKHCTTSSHTFATRQEMHDYLAEYVEHFTLWPYIHTNKKVVKVKPLDAKCAPDQMSWLVTVEDTQTFSISVFHVDYIVSCVGVNYYPKIPQIEGMTTFQGKIVHSKFAKDPEEFRDKQVVCMGLGPSCADLCLRLAPVAKKVVACHRFPGGFSLGMLPENVTETETVQRLTASSVLTENGENIECDALILCTGYVPHFPFLNTFALTNTCSDITDNLYKKMFVPKYPSICFINAHGIAQEFLLMEIQAKYLTSLLEEKIKLPTCEEMEDAVLNDACYNINKSQSKLSESLRSDQYAMKGVQDYLEDLAREGGFLDEFQDIPLHLAIWQCVIKRIFGFLAVYRSDRVNVINPTKWEYICGPSDDTKEKIRQFVIQDGKLHVEEENGE